MSCAFGEIVFGWPWNSAVEDVLRTMTKEELELIDIYDIDPSNLDEDEKFSTDDAEALGFETFYSAGGDEVLGYLGVKLCDVNVYEPTLMSSFTLEPTEEQKKIVEDKWASLPQALAVELGEPKVWIVWGDT